MNNFIGADKKPVAVDTPVETGGTSWRENFHQTMLIFYFLPACLPAWPSLTKHGAFRSQWRDDMDWIRSIHPNVHTLESWMRENNYTGHFDKSTLKATETIGLPRINTEVTATL
ncbi:hypothetical protein M0805_004987 [Coniferiporia weirii]|nr:hypothetical protein M0805_004987 [Coniferiporia weirii]